MVELTDSARKELDSYFAENEKAPVRVFLHPGGCSGPALALALDEPTDNDEVFDLDGLTVIVEKKLHANAEPITIDMGEMGFNIKSSLQLPQGGGCASCGGGCSC